MGQESNYIFQKFTTQDGLPSNECHKVIEDSHGYIWIGTDRGIVKYNGYDFRYYGVEDGIDEMVIFEIFEDECGRIWVGGIKNQLYVYDRESDKFKSYKYNGIIADFIKDKNRLYILKIYVEKEKVYLSITRFGLLIIDAHGKVNFVNDKNNIYIMIDNKQNVHYAMVADSISLYNTIINIESYSYFFCNNRIELNKKELNSGLAIENFNAVLFDDYLLISLDNKIMYYDNDTSYLIKAINANVIEQDQNHNPVFFLNDRKELVRYFDISKPEYEVIFANIEATGFLEDTRGGYWVTTISNGVLYIKNPKIQYLNLEFQNDVFFAIEKLKDNSIAISKKKKAIFVYDFENKKITYKKKVVRFTYNLLKYDEQTGYLWVGLGSDLIAIDAANKGIPITSYGSPQVCVFFKDKCILGGPNNRYKIIPRQPKIYAFEKATYIFSRNQNFRINCSNKIQDNLYFGTMNGLFRVIELNNGKTETVPEFKNRRVQSLFADSLNHTMLVATLDGGLGILHEDYCVDFITKRDGLSSNNLEDAKTSESGNIWIASLKGLSKISIKDGVHHIENFSTSYGLPTNNFNECEIINGKVYATSDHGVIVFDENISTIDTFRPKPKIISIFNESDRISLDRNWDFPYNKNELKIDYLTIDYAHVANMMYRYRVNSGPWIETKNRELFLTKLQPNKYLIEIQSQNKQGLWSDSSTFSFKINKPWWASIWFRSISALCFILIIHSVFRYVNQKNVEKKKYLDEIRILEKEALNSQMNPHFIFNCLNSIQSYIMLNEKTLAMRYLAQFAHLIRLFLEANKEDKITLSDEISLLDNYCELEKMRIPNRFQYKISKSNNLEFNEIKIPPFLIQPFVENAITHGMKGKNDNSGCISIDFVLIDNLLHITVQDNGHGIQTTHNAKRKSFGMNLTKKRLDLIYAEAGKNFDLKIDSDECGTKILIQIPIR
ncbi:MAG: histidine kinase [Lewinellaceae bacterium]|nr:histidine kinase [Lewinellaceae bacterium]